MKNEKLEIKENLQKQYRGYKKVIAEAVTLAPTLGTDAADEKLCTKYNLKQVNIFPRINGKIVFKPSWIRAGLRDSGSVFEVSGNFATNQIFDYRIEIISKKLKTSIHTKTIQPINKGRKEGRVSNYEMLPEGIKYRITCLVPFSGSRGVTQKIFKKWLEIMLRSGIGSYRKGEYGVSELTSFKVVSINA